ncbi:MAG TPA: tRNA 2-thiouridine(34) synthase MnmA [Aggregatilinea sp.]|uniref:tRNA 2-thiouridine(34) synthase MnmA n=1 Tax=Aggregatilinea sp. TaxID=2806333 RepID=UPI002C133F3E|nr:tRNA 2-thiouridine(34) synthase MnmA [Aggregatilinea sp.]HML21656.1 tRNA 2-thiouridine(34) synthase MnmA [Aggregatilinea sp.]
MNSKPRVVVAMSGGVDSSVAAALLVEQGYDVIGMMMRLWSEDCGDGGANRCCTPGQMADARRIADQLGIPFYVIDTQDVFRGSIVQFFIDRYAAGDTPNPCLECNRHIRFEWLLNHALAMKADFLATGHYARVQRDADGTTRLLKGLDDAKDQSYVLSVLTQDKLRHAMFPVGDYAKPVVREMAAKFNLPVAQKHDSQDLCFLADGDYRRFLAEHALQAIQPGPIVTRDGRELGQHTGLPHYTVGQRKGLAISAPEPLYVLEADPARNALIVGTLDELGRRSLIAGRVNWTSGDVPDAPFRAEVKIRYKARPAPATVTPGGPDRVQVTFDAPLRDITPGQGAVFYDGDVCLGGGIIAQAL